VQLLVVGSASAADAVSHAARSGARVRRADGADEALAVLAANGEAVDALVLPADAPDVVATLRRIRDLDADVGILVLCPSANEEDLGRALRVEDLPGGEILVRSAAAPGLEAELSELAARSERRRTPPADAAAQAPAAAGGALGSLLDRAPVGVVVAAPDGTIAGWNRRAGAMLELSPALRGSRLDERFPEPARAKLWALVADAGADSAPAVLARGERRLEVSAAPSPDDAGEAQVVLLLADVTERERAQALLEAQYEIASFLAASRGVEQVAPHALAAVCRTLDWQLGAFWRVDRFAGVLRFVDVWSADPELARRFGEDSRDVVFTRGSGMMGGTWGRGAPIWVEDLATERELEVRRRSYLLGLGLRAFFNVAVRGRSEVLGVLEFASTRPREPQPEVTSALQATGAQVGQLLERELVQEELRRVEEHRARLAGAILAAEGEERARIAAELHDDTIQVLAASLLQLDMLRRSVEDRPQALRRVARLRETLTEAGDRARRLTFALRPQVLEAHGLGPAVTDLMQQAFEGTDTERVVEAPEGRLPWAVEELAYRTISEAIANARTHAGADHVAVRLRDDGDALAGEVADDGCGFDVARVLADRRHRGSEYMAERVRLAGGELVIDSAPGRGTRVAFSLPHSIAEAAPRRGAASLYAQADEWIGLLNTLFEAAPVGLAFWDRSFRFVRVNERLAEINGRSVDEHIGRTVAEVVPGVWPATEPVFRTVLEEDRAVHDIEVSGETPAQPGKLRHWLASYYPVRGRRGETVGIGGVVVEVTERKAAEEERLRLLAAERRARAEAEVSRDRIGALAHASAALAQSIELDATVEQVLGLVVPDLAEWALLDLLPGSRLVAAGARHAEPSRSSWLEGLQRANPQRSPAVARLLARGRPLLLGAGAGGDLAAAGREPLLDELAPTSLLLAPLVVAGRAIGVLTLGTREHSYGGDDIDFVSQLATRAALALENARLYEERTATARALQRSLLPPELPPVPGAELAVRYQPVGAGTEVGGDFYDVFRIRKDEWGLAIGDVTGKGPSAAAVTGLVRHTLRAVAPYRGGTGALEAVNDALLAEHMDRYCTLAFGRLRSVAGGLRVRLSLAGHPFPLLLRRDGSIERAGHAGPLLGAFAGPSLRSADASLARGDALVLYTDGITEARREGELFGEPRLAAVVREAAGSTAEQIAERIESAVHAFSPRLTDDLAILVLRAVEGGA
jgi:PAS domain S-box-containing protein